MRTPPGPDLGCAPLVSDPPALREQSPLVPPDSEGFVRGRGIFPSRHPSPPAADTNRWAEMALVCWTLNLQEGQGEDVSVPRGDLPAGVWIPCVDRVLSGGLRGPQWTDRVGEPPRAHWQPAGQRCHGHCHCGTRAEKLKEAPERRLGAAVPPPPTAEASPRPRAPSCRPLRGTCGVRPGRDGLWACPCQFPLSPAVPPLTCHSGSLTLLPGVPAPWTACT